MEVVGEVENIGDLEEGAKDLVEEGLDDWAQDRADASAALAEGWAAVAGEGLGLEKVLRAARTDSGAAEEG